MVEAVLALEERPCDEVGIHFVGLKEICRLHDQYFDDPTSTDCISFPIDSSESPVNALGDVFVCPYIACKYAEEHHLDPYQELTLYVVHGLLHLIGYDDMEEADRAMMRKAEKDHMRYLVKNNLIIA